MPEEKTFDELSYLRSEVRRLRQTLNLLTPALNVVLKRREFLIYKKEPGDDLLIPAGKFLEDYYKTLHRYSFRLFLRDVIKQQNFFTCEKVTRFATAGVTEEYIQYLEQIGLIKKHKEGFALTRHIKSFGETLEWFVAEVFKREFGAEAIWGVKFKRPNVGGDYDVLARIYGSVLLYAEVKSSPPKQIYDNEISAFLDRVSDLAPEVSVFFMDTELRMKDKIVPMFEEALRKRHMRAEVARIEKELFQIRNKIFIINSKDSIVRNLETVMNWCLRRSVGE